MNPYDTDHYRRKFEKMSAEEIQAFIAKKNERKIIEERLISDGVSQKNLKFAVYKAMNPEKIRDSQRRCAAYIRSNEERREQINQRATMRLRMKRWGTTDENEIARMKQSEKAIIKDCRRAPIRDDEIRSNEERRAQINRRVAMRNRMKKWGTTDLAEIEKIKQRDKIVNKDWRYAPGKDDEIKDQWKANSYVESLLNKK